MRLANHLDTNCCPHGVSEPVSTPSVPMCPVSQTRGPGRAPQLGPGSGHGTLHSFTDSFICVVNPQHCEGGWGGRGQGQDPPTVQGQSSREEGLGSEPSSFPHLCRAPSLVPALSLLPC